MFPLCATVLYTYAHIHTYVRVCVRLRMLQLRTYVSVTSPSFSTSFHSQHY